MAQANLKAFVPDLAPTGRVIRHRVLVAGDPHTSEIVEVRLGQRPDRRDFLPSRCLAKRKGIGDQCGRLPLRGRPVCEVHGAGSTLRQRNGDTLPPEVTGALGSAIRDVRRGKRKLDTVAAFFPHLRTKVEQYRQDADRLDLRDDAAILSALRDLFTSGEVDADLPTVVKMLTTLTAAKARVLSTRAEIERRHAVPVEDVHRLVEQLVGIIRRNVPQDRHEFVARELQLIGSRSATG